MKYILFVIAIVIMIALTIVVIRMEIFSSGTCMVVREAWNTGASRKAVLFLVQAHTTVADSYQVSIMDATESPEDGDRGNVFIVDGDHGSVSLDSTAIDLRWRGGDTLQITYDRRLRTFAMNDLVDGVVVVYTSK